jgi:hypothetical protein
MGVMQSGLALNMAQHGSTWRQREIAGAEVLPHFPAFGKAGTDRMELGFGQVESMGDSP